ncbi:MAG: hypothetical protein ACRDOO_19670 [Actinomadura sp.]
MSEGLLPGGSTPGGDGYRFVPGTAGLIARRLDAAGAELDGCAIEAPDAGLCTAPVAAVLALFAESLDGIVEGLRDAAHVVAYNRQVYANAEEGSTVTITDTACTLDDPQ